MNHRDDIAELRQLLQTLDAEPAPQPDFADELWADLEASYDSIAATPSGGPSAEITVLHRQEPSARKRRWDGRGLVAAAAAICIVLAGIGVWRASDGPQTPDDIFGDTVTEVCAQYRSNEPSLADLARDLPSGQITADDVRSQADALTLLRDQLDTAVGVETLIRYENGMALLSQLEIEVDRGLLEQAGRTLDRVRNVVETHTATGSGNPPTDTCTAPR